MTAAVDREGLREALRQEMARRGFAGWYGRDEYDDHPVQCMWERTVDAQLAGPLLSTLLTQADSAERMEAERDEARAENDRLRERLEIKWAYDGAGNRIPFPERMKHYDGIACRDETIKGLEEQVARLSAEVGALRAGLERIKAEPGTRAKVSRWAFYDLQNIAAEALARTADKAEPEGVEHGR